MKKVKFLTMFLLAAMVAANVNVYASTDNTSITTDLETYVQEENVGNVNGNRSENGEILEASAQSEFIESLDKSIFGGCYMTDDDQLCFTAVETGLPQLQNKLSKARGLDTRNISVESVKYSLNDLDQAKQQLLAQKDELEISLVGFDEMRNGLAVYLFNPTDEKQQKIREKCSVENIIFYPLEILPEPDFSDENSAENEATTRAATLTYLKGGEWLYKGSSRISSVGYRAKSGSNYGYVTCGHDWARGNTVSASTTRNNNDPKLATVGTVQLNEQRNLVDASFIPSNIKWSGLRDGTMAVNADFPIMNAKVIFDGARHYDAASGGRVFARVQSTGIDGDISGVPFKDFFLIDQAPYGGDSGAAILQQGTNGKYSLIGLIKSTWWKYNDDTSGYLTWGTGCKWYNIARGLGISFTN